MKISKFLIWICLMFICSVNTNYAIAQGRIAVTISESDNIYQLKTKYDKAKTRSVQEYMTQSLRETGFKFTNTQLDASLALTGGINFYIKSNDGGLVLKFDKRKNKAEDFTRFKKMCEGIREIIQKS